MIHIRKLNDLDLDSVNHFLDKYWQTSLLMQSNIRSAGLIYKGLHRQGDHFGAFDDHHLVGITGHYWNGNVMIQAEKALKELSSALVQNAFETNRSIHGFLGPDDQIQHMIEILQLSDWPKQLNARERLLVVDLDKIIIPTLLNDPDLYQRAPTEFDRALMMKWRYDYEVETGISDPSEATKEKIKTQVEDSMSNGCYWLFDYQDQTVALAGFNAVTDTIVQPGGIWVIPEFRNKGFAKAITASILKLAYEKWGKTKSVIFTNNPAAENAYQAIGYEFIGHYALVILAQPYVPQKNVT